MATAYNIRQNLARGARARGQFVQDPGSGGTVHVGQIDLAVLVIASTGARTLQAASQIPEGTRLLVLVTASGVSVNSVSIGDGEYAKFIVTQDSSGDRQWVQDGGVGGTSGGVDLNGIADALVLDADGDTTLSAPTDDQIDVEIGGVDHVVFKAVAAADSAATTNIVEIAATTPIDTTGTNTHNFLVIDAAIGNSSGGTNAVNAIQIDAITGDAQVTETAVNIGTGWDVGIAAASPIVLTAASSVTGAGSTVATLVPDAQQEDAPDPGAISVATYLTTLTTGGAEAFSLANGVQAGQVKRITLAVTGGDATLTITTPADENTVVFSVVGDTVDLLWNGSAWRILAAYNVATGAVTTPVLSTV